MDKVIELLIVAVIGIGTSWITALQQTESKIKLLRKELGVQHRAKLDETIEKYSGVILLSAADLQDRLWHLTQRQSCANPNSKSRVLLGVCRTYDFIKNNGL